MRSTCRNGNLVFLRIKCFLFFLRKHETWSFFLQVKGHAGITPGFTRFGFFQIKSSSHFVLKQDHQSRELSVILHKPVGCGRFRSVLEATPIASDRMQGCSSGISKKTTQQDKNVGLRFRQVQHVALIKYVSSAFNNRKCLCR